MPSVFRFLATVVVISAVLRIGAAVYLGPAIEERPGVTDEVSYHTLAVRVTEGHGFTFGSNWWPATRANQPTAHWSFLYVLFLAAIYTIAGPVPLVARLVQASVVAVLHPWLAWRVANRLFGPSAGMAAAAVTAVYGYFVYYSGALVTESLYIVAVLWTLDIATAIASRATGEADRGRLRSWLWLGVAAAVATLLRQAFLLMVPLVLAWTAWRTLRAARSLGVPRPTRRLVAGRAAAAWAVVVLAILPWTARNYRAFGQLVPLNTNAGFVMFWANHPIHGTSFKPILPYDGAVNYRTLLPAELKPLNEAAIDRELLRRGIQFAKDDPVRYVLLSAGRAAEYFRFWPSADSGLASNLVRLLSFGLLLPFLVTGLVMAFADRPRRAGSAGAELLVIVAASYTLVHLLTWTLIRYRLPVDAMMIPFAGVSLAAAATRLRRKMEPPWSVDSHHADRSARPELGSGS